MSACMVCWRLGKCLNGGVCNACDAGLNDQQCRAFERARRNLDLLYKLLEDAVGMHPTGCDCGGCLLVFDGEVPDEHRRASLQLGEDS